MGRITLLNSINLEGMIQIDEPTSSFKKRPRKSLLIQTFTKDDALFFTILREN